MAVKKLVLIDGSYYLFRAYHAITNLKNPQGEPSGAVYGVINMINKHLKNDVPDYFGVVFDAKGKTFRNDLYPAYKSNRPPMPNDLSTQIEPLHQIIQAMGVPLLKIDGVEADDVIATLSKQAALLGINTVVSTGDKDLAQIVNDKIHLINPMNNVYLNPEGVKKNYGVPPERMIDYLSLVGDSVDNVPGVPKVGPKTAIKWIEQYGCIDKIMTHAHEITGKVGENLREFLPQLPLSRRLVTLNDQVELKYGPEDLVIKDQDSTNLKALYHYWGFRSLLTGLSDKNQVATKHDLAELSAPDTNKLYEKILTVEQLDKWLARFNKAELIAISIETTSTDYLAAEIVGIAFAVSENHAAYMPLQHNDSSDINQLGVSETLKKLKPFLEDSSKYKVGHDLKHSIKVLANYGINLSGIKHDTMLASYAFNSIASRHNLNSLVSYYLNTTTTRYTESPSSSNKPVVFNQLNINVAAAYASENVDVTLKLNHFLSKALKKNTALESIYNTIEMPLLNVLAKIEQHGVIIDSTTLREQTQSLSNKMHEVESAAYQAAGEKFNINSPKQIQYILYTKIGLPAATKTATGQKSTAEATLQKLAEHHELPRLILEYRGISKLQSTYTEKLPKMINQKTGRVHTSYHQAITSTGRLSSSDPNLQNIPIRSNEGRKIRQAFIAPEGYTLVAADYSQIELRIMAHLSGDQGLLDAFTNKKDIHTATAAEVFSVPIDTVNTEQRRAAKAINFGLIYGMSAFGLAKQLGIGRAEAQEYVNLYFNRYPQVKVFMDDIRKQASACGYVETLYGRRLYLPEINARNAPRRHAAERTAINAPMQGTAADIIKLSMINIDQWFKQTNIKAKMIMQVHDELVFEVANENREQFIQEIRPLMVNNDRLLVPLEVDIGYGYNWDEAH